MSNRAGIFVTAPLHCRIMKVSRGDLLAGTMRDSGEDCGSAPDYLFLCIGCVRTLSSTAPLSVYTLMFSYFTASDIFMEENLFILGTKLDLIINKLASKIKLESISCFYFKSKNDCDCFFCWRIIYLV